LWSRRLLKLNVFRQLDSTQCGVFMATNIHFWKTMYYMEGTQSSAVAEMAAHVAQLE